MSKFFAGGVSDSDLSSSEDEDLYASSVQESQSSSEEEESLSESGSAGGQSDSDEEGDGQPSQRAPYSRSQFLKGQGSSSSDEDSEDEDHKVVKSAKNKLLDEVDTHARGIEQAHRSNDWVAATAQFDKLLKVADRANRQYETVPLSFVQCLSELENVLADKPKTKLSPANSKAQNTIRQRLKKAVREYESRMASYRNDPGSYQPTLPLLSSKVTSPEPSSNAKSATKVLPELPLRGQTFSAEAVFPILLSVVESRGKKNTDRQEQLSVLEQLLEVSATPYQRISVLLVLLPIRFDLTSSGSVMPLTTWNAIDRDLRTLFDVLEEQSEYIVIESAPEVDDLEKGPTECPAGVKQIPGSVSALVERLDDEHARALQTIDPHTTEYIERLRDESRVYDLLLRAQCHAEHNLARVGILAANSEALCRLLVRRLDHVYYKPPAAIEATEAAAWQRVPNQLDSKITPRPAAGDAADTVDIMKAICNVLYHQPNTAYRTRAVLSLVYHYALTDHYYQARDLLLMSHLQSTIHTAEPSTQVMFNRALVQVGLCAFRCGLINDALQSLGEICGSSRLKELLGQGPARYQQGSDRSYGHSNNAAALASGELLPFHMHINLELIECVYLTCSMLVEVPFLATGASQRTATDLKKRTLNRPFRRLLDYHDRQVFSGPSENTRDHVIQAAKALQSGDWRAAYSLLKSIKVWSLLAKPVAILGMLESKLKVEGLRTWLLTYGSSYKTVAVQSLSTQFALSATEIHKVVTRMILSDELAGHLDVDGEFVILRAEADATRLQGLAVALSERVTAMAERNERLATDGHGPDNATRQRTSKSTRPRLETAQ